MIILIVKCMYNFLKNIVIIFVSLTIFFVILGAYIFYALLYIIAFIIRYIKKTIKNTKNATKSII